jgi:hypothetical protein
MNKISFLFCLAAIVTLSACKKNDFNGGDTSLPDVPVTVSNLFGMYNGVSTVSTSVAGGGTITVTLAIPSGKGRTIKEITRVGVATTPANYKVVEVPTGLYTSAPIPGNGTSVTFTTSLSEYTAKTGLATPTAATAGTATSFLARYFIFLVTLDNGDQIYPQGVRVYVDK